MRRQVSWAGVGLMVVVSSALRLAAGPAAAAEEDLQSPPQASCSFTTPMHFSPGISGGDGTGLLYASDTNFSGAERGTVACIGTIGGHRISGPGTFGFVGKWTEGNCVANKGAGRYSFTVPTADGTKQFAGRYTEERVGFNGTVNASQPEGRFAGVFHIVPTGTLTNAETCEGKPITQASLVFTGVWSN
jgi:hypothetical protein